LNEGHQITHKIAVDLKKLVVEENKLIKLEEHRKESDKLNKELKNMIKKHNDIEDKINEIEQQIKNRTQKVNNKDVKVEDVNFIAEFVNVLHDNQKNIITKIIDMTNEHDNVKNRVQSVHNRTMEIIKDVEALLLCESKCGNYKEQIENIKAHTNYHTGVLANVKKRLSEVENIKDVSSNMIDIFTKNEKRVICVILKAKKPLSYDEIGDRVGLSQKTIQKLISSIMKRTKLISYKEEGVKKKKFFWIESSSRDLVKKKLELFN
jgi:DNA-binding CsgD family transcriptional regulator/iron-sulfur cluster repair protein YtfE (RIC family)